jgi:hypothetical protein
VNQPPKSVVREIRTPRSVGTGGGRPPPVTRWAFSNERPYRVHTMENEMTGRALWLRAKPIIDKSKKELDFWGRTLTVSAMALGCIFLIAKWLGLVSDNDAPLHPADVNIYWAIGLFCAVTIGLFLLREVDRTAYGATEIVFAVLSYVVIVRRAVIDYDLYTLFFTSAGLIYVGVRGLDNVVTGVKARYRNK